MEAWDMIQTYMFGMGRSKPSKIEVNGKNEAPLYKFLKLEKGGLFGNGIKWNFTKFLVNKEGKVVERYAHVTAPLKFEKDIQNLLESS
ncbi:PREDICTED: probable phospholipid hydroperoxide glutathione peroxidase-like [Fragaria vesca subsp. vesca]